MPQFRLTTVGAWSAILMVPVLVLGVGLLATSGAQDLLPATGPAGEIWLLAVAGHTGRFTAGGWLLVLMGFLAMVAFVGIQQALPGRNESLVLAPVLGLVGMTLVQASHLIPIAMASHLAPAFAAATGPARTNLATLSDTLAAVAQLLNTAGNAVVWGVTVPMLAWTILRTGAMARPVGWLGVVAAVFAGWLGPFAAASPVVEGLSTIGFLAFFLFMPSAGVSILRRQRRPAQATSAADAVPARASR